jgi:hypothetical protein
VCLYNLDENWHFFEEEEEGIYLRCSVEYSNNLRDWLKDSSSKYTSKSYVEDSYIVTVFPDYFMKVFHLNSLMAIDFYEGKFLPSYLKEEEKPTEKQINIAKSIWVGAISERISHCFLNNLQNYTSKYKEQSTQRFGEDSMWESYILAEQIIDRSVWTGMRKAYLDAKNRKEKDDIK